MAAIAEILYVWAKVVNWRETRRKRKEMQQYDTPSHGFVYFRPVEAKDIPRIQKLEISVQEAGYPADEAASAATLEFRARQASDLFLVALASDSAQASDVLVGYTCGTLTAAQKLTEHSMAQHEPTGQTLCLHSVCVAPEHQRQGIATRMVKAYLVYIQQTCPQIHSVQLICKEELIPLYKATGFTLLGPSSVVHGKSQWFDMIYHVSDD